MYVHLRGERAERGGLFSRVGNLILLFYQGWWSIEETSCMTLLQNTWRRENRAVVEGMAPAELHAEDEHLPLQLSVFVQRDVPGEWMEVPRLPAHRYSAFHRSDQHALVSAENIPVWFYWWILYNQLRFDTYQWENNSGTKAAGIPQSQQPNSEHHKRGSKVIMRSFVLFPNYTSVGIKSNSTLQGWERWVSLPDMSLGLGGGKREDHASYSASKVCFNYMSGQDSTFPTKYRHIKTVVVLYINLLNLMIFTSILIALILGFLFFTKEKNRKKL